MAGNPRHVAPFALGVGGDYDGIPAAEIGPPAQSCEAGAAGKGRGVTAETGPRLSGVGRAVVEVMEWEAGWRETST